MITTFQKRRGGTPNAFCFSKSWLDVTMELWSLKRAHTARALAHAASLPGRSGARRRGDDRDATRDATWDAPPDHVLTR